MRRDGNYEPTASASNASNASNAGDFAAAFAAINASAAELVAPVSAAPPSSSDWEAIVDL